MLTTLKRIFFGDDRLFLHGSHLERVLRDDEFHSVPNVGEIVDGPNTCQLVLNYERDGHKVIQGVNLGTDRHLHHSVRNAGNRSGYAVS